MSPSILGEVETWVVDTRPALTAPSKVTQIEATDCRATPQALVCVEEHNHRTATGPSKVDVKNIADVPAFTTIDSSEIRELLAHRNSCIRNQSLAEARLPVGGQTVPHFHRLCEEIYYLLAGTGRMQVEDDVRDVRVGDSIAIPAGARHQISNTGEQVLKFLCCCAPAYEDSDTVLVEDWPR